MAVDGAGRVASYLPRQPYNDLHDDDPEETFRALLASLGPLGLAYCHTIRMPSTVSTMSNCAAKPLTAR